MQQRLPGHEPPPPGVRGSHVSSPRCPALGAVFGGTLMIYRDWLSRGGGAAAESEGHSEGLFSALNGHGDSQT